MHLYTLGSLYAYPARWYNSGYPSDSVRCSYWGLRCIVGIFSGIVIQLLCRDGLRSHWRRLGGFLGCFLSRSGRISGSRGLWSLVVDRKGCIFCTFLPISDLFITHRVVSRNFLSFRTSIKACSYIFYPDFAAQCVVTLIYWHHWDLTWRYTILLSLASSSKITAIYN